MSSLIERLIAGGPVITDGAWGTELQARGLACGEFPDDWNLTHPDAVLEVARANVEAGSRVVLTNTFGAKRVRIGEHECAGQVAEINRAGVEISRAAAGSHASVFASMGPSGKVLMMDETSPQELADAYGEQAGTLAEAGADAIVVETMSDPEEAQIAVRAASSTGLPVVGCMVFDSGRDMDRTMMGTTVEEAAGALSEAGADVIGANCGQGIEGFIPICRRLHDATDRPIWIKANAGLPELVDGKPEYRATPDGFARFVPALTGAGATFIGGCCGTNPDFIRALAENLPVVDQ